MIRITDVRKSDPINLEIDASGDAHLDKQDSVAVYRDNS